MSKLLLTAFLIAIFGISSTTADCSNDNINKINTCFTNFFQNQTITTPSAENLRANYITAMLGQESRNYYKFCDDKAEFDKCLEEGDIIKECFNTKDIMRIDIGKSEPEARMIVATYLQMDYTCGKAKMMTWNLYHCLTLMESNCTSNTSYANCQNAAALISCQKQTKSAETQCGLAASCLYQKFFTLETCIYPNLGGCDICGSLTGATNPVDALCSDDVYSSGNANYSIFFGIVISFALYFVC